MSEAGVESCFPQIAANPYPWPFDGRWSVGTTAYLLFGFQTEAIATLDAAEAAAVAGRILAAVRSARIRVIFSRRTLGAGANPMASRHGGENVPPNSGIADALAPRRGEPIVDHAGDNAFLRTDLAAQLRVAGIRNLLIAGLPTDGLMHASMRAANDHGFECLAIADACAGTQIGFHEAQLRITAFGNGLFGAVADSAAVLAALKAPPSSKG
ncbi:isochorismatase family protein [Methylocapsa sp. S129]|uniref:isochorismatase family protein n=1 Tax=Methylocapsa sp. S129 TaxID=1641869 RepID=UPI00131C1D9D|nr:isochorismatase family protein [Methylocapsa sp. S129]